MKAKIKLSTYKTHSLFNSASNTNGTILDLDLVFSNTAIISVTQCTSPLVPCAVYHPLLLIIIHSLPKQLISTIK